MVVFSSYAYWSEKNKYDPAVWAAKLENDLVVEWRFYFDTTEIRNKFDLK